MMKALLPLFILTALYSTAIVAQDCPKLYIKDLPKKDLPPAGFKTNGRSSTDYYYGIGVPENYDTARYLAVKEMELDTEDPVSGAAVLMMLYANGYGVERNLDLAIKLACGNVGFAEAEVNGRMAHLQQMKEQNSNDRFDICDDITSGYMMGFCASIVSSKNDYERQLAMKESLGKWPAKDTAAFGLLRKAATDFFDRRSDAEVDQSGTGRVAFTTGEYDALEAGFANKIDSLNNCLMQKFSADDFAKADKELNAVYKKLMSTQNFEWGTITLDGIKQTQRAWLKYRDAWVAFGKLKCPAVSAETWMTTLTEERLAQLKEFVEE